MGRRCLAADPPIRWAAEPEKALTSHLAQLIPCLALGCAVTQPATGVRLLQAVVLLGNRPSGLPVLSGDAGRVAFNSAARLLSGPWNRHDQIYVRDRLSRATALVSVSTLGDLANNANLGRGSRSAQTER